MGAPVARTLAEIRRDIRFTVDYGVGRPFENLSYLYNVTDLIVQVRWYQAGFWYERYGVLVDFESCAEFGENTYILEIPASGNDPRKRAQSQIETIKRYVDEMRTEWKSLTDRVSGRNQPMVVGYWDKLQKWKESAEGRWDVLRAFQHNTMPGTMPVPGAKGQSGRPTKTPSNYRSFYHWLIARDPDLAELQRQRLSCAEEAAPSLQRFWIPLEAGQKYEIFLDWAVPYICFEEDWKVSQFKTSGNASHLFYPFHNFQSPGLPGTVYTPPSAGRRRDELVRLRATHYTPFAFWTYLIECIDLQKQQAYELLKPYYTYVANLAAVGSVFANYGPLRGLSLEQLQTAGSDAAKKFPAWNGNVHDGSPAHEQQIALAMRDLQDAQRLFAGVIKTEARSGRTGDINVQIEANCFSLTKSLFSPPSQQQFEDLWAHNRDVYGFDLYFEKANLLISQSSAAGSAYDRFMERNLYEHPVLDSPRASHKAPPDGSFWPGAAYRTNTLMLALWTMYYRVRETKMAVRARASTPHAMQVADWFRRYTPGAAAAGRLPTWWLHDEGQRKLVNYMLGGGTLGKLKEIEAEILVEVNRLLGSKTKGSVSRATIDEIRNRVIKARFEQLIRDKGVDVDRPTRVLGPAHIAINMYMVVISVRAGSAANWTGEAQFAFVAASVGLVSDGLGYFMFRIWMVQATLNTSAMATTAVTRGVGVAARSAGLGLLEALGGGAGGLLGIVWYGYSAVADYRTGDRKHAILDGVAAAGVALTMTGLFLDSSVVGIVPGIACNIVGVCMITIAELIKVFSLWKTQSERYVEALYKGPATATPAGAQRLSHWFAEYAEGVVHWDHNEFNTPQVKALTRRLDAMLVDMDTFDNFTPKMD